ncbi:MAG: hypothetical protein HY763_14175 [Planctomycetes bacterium]|nr:hypothetical protein [Planctomycetota bacterium]
MSAAGRTKRVGWVVVHFAAAGAVAGGESAPVAKDTRSAHAAVHDGNLKLRAGAPQAALEDYEYARSLVPEAPEIPFSEGVAKLRLKDYAGAREAFERSATATDSKLAADSLYGTGSAYHAEALDHLNEPKVALEDLESALQWYQSALAVDPGHPAARDAQRKAATLRRQVKQQMQQQQQPQQGQEQGEEGEQQDDQQSPSESQASRKKKEEQDGEQSDAEPQSSPEQQADEQQASQKSQNQRPADDKQEQQAQAQSGESKADQAEGADEDKQPSDEERQTAAEEKADTSRQQAERRLREMMQALRNRQKERRETSQRPVVTPVDKDW